MINRLKEKKFGTFREVLYYYGKAESIAIVTGDVENGEDNFVSDPFKLYLSSHF